MELLTKLGIDWRLLLAQIVNFLFVLAVLYKFLYRPLLTFLDQRRDRIEQSLREAKRIETELKSIEVKKAEAMAEARQQAQEVIAQAEAMAEAQRQETLLRVRGEAEKVIAEARLKIEAEQAAAIKAVRREAAKLVVQATTRVIGKLPGAVVDKELAEAAVAEVSKRS